MRRVAQDKSFELSSDAFSQGSSVESWWLGLKRVNTKKNFQPIWDVIAAVCAQPIPNELFWRDVYSFIVQRMVLLSNADTFMLFLNIEPESEAKRNLQLYVSDLCAIQGDTSTSARRFRLQAARYIRAMHMFGRDKYEKHPNHIHLMPVNEVLLKVVRFAASTIDMKIADKKVQSHINMMRDTPADFEEEMIEAVANLRVDSQIALLLRIDDLAQTNSSELRPHIPPKRERIAHRIPNRWAGGAPRGPASLLSNRKKGPRE